MIKHVSNFSKKNIMKLRTISKALAYSSIIIAASSCVDSGKEIIECDPCTSPLTYEGYETIFTDEFDLASIDNKWNFVLGNGCPDECGWGLSQELEYYQKQNVEFVNGNLIIKAKEETVGDNLYTSGNINTLGKYSMTYGRIDVRAKLPKGQGIWPAIWLLGDNIAENPWPTPGHISIVEMIGGDKEGRDNTIYGKLIWGTPDATNAINDSFTLRKGVFNDKFHVFSVIWEPTKIQWLVDDNVYFESDIDSSMEGTFNKPFHLNIKLAVGGKFPGNPDGTTIFPQELQVDYIRVFQKDANQ